MTLFWTRTSVAAGFPALLLMSSAMTPAATARASSFSDGVRAGNWSPPKCGDGKCEEIETFWNSRYGICDAEALGKYWKIDVWSAKLLVGRKIMLENDEIVAMELRDAFRQGGCHTAFNFGDAAGLADLWTSGVAA